MVRNKSRVQIPLSAPKNPDTRIEIGRSNRWGKGVGIVVTDCGLFYVGGYKDCGQFEGFSFGRTKADGRCCGKCRSINVNGIGRQPGFGQVVALLKCDDCGAFLFSTSLV